MSRTVEYLLLVAAVAVVAIAAGRYAQSVEAGIFTNLNAQLERALVIPNAR